MRLKPQRFDPRQTMRCDSFEIFHYHEAKPIDVEVHHHDFYEIYLFLHGQAEYWVEGRVFRLAPGDILLMSPLEMHRPLIDPVSKAYERIVLWMNKEYLEHLSTEEMNLTRCFGLARRNHRNLIRPSARVQQTASTLLDTLVQENSGCQPGAGLMSKALLMQFMVELNRVALEMDASGEPQRESPSIVTRVLPYINAHCSEDLSLETLALRFSVSKYHLSRRFTEEVGVSVYRYITMRRMLLAKQMLLDGKPASDVCYACGYRDYAGFYRAFKAEYGMNPQTFAKGSPA